MHPRKRTYPVVTRRPVAKMGPRIAQNVTKLAVGTIRRDLMSADPASDPVN